MSSRNSQPAPEALPKLLSINQLTEWLQVSRQSLYVAIAAGRFPKPLKLGRQAVRFVEADVLAALKQGGLQ
jgi:predicted DNA-binding transcriptional regulator AlpA